jgi:hypothetical protein
VKLRAACTLATMFLLLFTVAAWSSPLDDINATENKPPETQSASGKIASVGEAEFTLSIGKDRNPKEIHFLIDGNTKVDGRLSVGAQATVDFKLDSGKNIATHVIVSPSSGLRSQ